MNASSNARRDVRLIDALLRLNAHPRDVAVGLGVCGALYFVGLLAVDLASAPSPALGRGVGAALALARGFTGVVAFIAALVAPVQTSTAIARDRANGAFDLAREAEASPLRRLAAYTFAPLWPTVLGTSLVFAASAPFAVDAWLSPWAWGAWWGVAVASQALSSVVAATWALMIPRVTQASQGIGVLAPAALALTAAVATMSVHTHRLPAALLVIAAAALAHWPVALALVARPERPRHAPFAALAAATGGIALAGVAWAFPSPQHPSATWFGAWAVIVAVATAAWTLPRGGRLALALREGGAHAGLVAVSTALGVSALFALGGAVIPSAVAPSPWVFAEGAALVSALSAALTAALVAVLSAAPARRAVWAGRAVLAGFAALFVEGMLARSGTSLAARLDPLANVWTRADVADGAGLRVALSAAFTLASIALARTAWSRATRRITAAIEGERA
jgi:hypothetical protein